jgi:hypothetical protein
MYYGSPQPSPSYGHGNLPEVEAMLSTITPLAAKNVLSQAACNALKEVRRARIATHHIPVFSPSAVCPPKNIRCRQSAHAQRIPLPPPPSNSCKSGWTRRAAMCSAPRTTPRPTASRQGWIPHFHPHFVILQSHKKKHK